MKRSQKILTILSAMVALGDLHLQAQEKSDSTKVLHLDEVVITATRSEKKPMDIGRSVTVIKSDEIKNSGANSLVELLSMQQGIFVVGAQQNYGSLSNLFMRGANSNQTVIMVDGMRITDPSSTDNSVDVSELSLENIDRIEIVGGSHSTLYGSSAIGGAINLITKKNNLKPGIHADIDIIGGSYRKNGSLLSQNILLNYSHKSGWYADIGLFNTGSWGFNASVDTVTNPKTYQHPDKSNPFHKTDAFGKIGYKGNKLDLYASYKYIIQHTSIDAGAFQDDENYVVDFRRNLFTYGASYKFNAKFSITYQGGTSDLVRKAVNDSSLVDYLGNSDHNYFSGTYKGTIVNNDLQANFHSKGIDFVAGGSWYKETMTAETYYYSTAFGKYESGTNLDTLAIHAETANGFVHADLNGNMLDDKFSIVNLALGARFVHHNLFGNVVTCEINPSLKLTSDALLYFSYSTGFNAPSLYQLYTPEKDPTSDITRGNKSLNPEKSQSFEIGLKQQLNNQLWYSIAYFNTEVKNVIDYVYLWNSSRPIDSLAFGDYQGDTYVNLGTQYSHGFEFSISSKISGKLLLSGNFTLVQGQIKYNPSGIDTSHTKGSYIQLFSNGVFVTKETESIGLVRRPNTANIFLTYVASDKLSFRINARYTGVRSDIYYDSTLGPYGALNTVDIKDYTLIDCSAKYNILEGLSAMLRIENIFDTNYSEIRGYATRGRGIYGAIRYSF